MIKIILFSVECQTAWHLVLFLATCHGGKQGFWGYNIQKYSKKNCRHTALKNLLDRSSSFLPNLIQCEYTLKGFLSPASDGGHRANPLFMLCATLANNWRSRHQASGLGSRWSMRSHTEADLPGYSGDPVLHGPTASSIQVISSQKRLQQRGHRWVAAPATLPGGLSNRWCELTHALSHPKHLIHSPGSHPFVLLFLLWILHLPGVI